MAWFPCFGCGCQAPACNMCATVPRTLYLTLTWKNGTKTVITLTWQNPAAFATYRALTHYGYTLRGNCPGTNNYTHAYMQCAASSTYLFYLAVICTASGAAPDPQFSFSGAAYAVAFNPNQKCNAPVFPPANNGPFYMEFLPPNGDHCFDGAGSPCAAPFLSAIVTETAPAELAEASADRRAPCVHRGEETGELRDCDTCAGQVRLKVLGCDVYGACTVNQAAEGLACCATCPDYQAGPEHVD